MTLSSTTRVVWLFTAYSYVVTTVSAAWFVRQSAELHSEPIGLWRSLAWQGAVFGLWLPVAGLVWLMLRRWGGGLRAMIGASLAGWVIVPVQALASLWIDQAFRGEAISLTAGMLGRAPVSILLYSAIIGFGLAAVHHRRAEDARCEANLLGEALAAARAAQAALPETLTRLMVMTGSRRTPVALDEVEWFASAGNYVVVHWGEREGLLRETMRALEARLDPAVFARSHRSTLVNLAQVREAQSLSDGSWRLTLKSGAELVASRTYRDALMARLGRT